MTFAPRRQEGASNAVPPIKGAKYYIVCRGKYCHGREALYRTRTCR